MQLDEKDANYSAAFQRTWFLTSHCSGVVVFLIAFSSSATSASCRKRSFKDFSASSTLLFLTSQYGDCG